MAEPPAAVVLVDKPRGWSSHDVVARARRVLGTRRVGHAGTLDPFATGLLLVLVGRATRVQRHLMALPKTYEVLAQLGATSSTGDTEGEIVRTGVLPSTDDLPTGSIQQRPPAFSAVKIDGERAYKRARRGEQVETKLRTVEVYEFSELWRREDRAAFRIRCASGTYVRSLIADLGDAYCLELRRLEIGPFAVQGAWDPAGERAPEPVSLDDALGWVLPVIDVDADAGRALGHGRPVAFEVRPSDPAAVLVRDGDGAVAVAEWADGVLRSRIGLRG